MSALISYSHLDRSLAKRFAKTLSGFDLKYWWDDRIALSSPWNAELEQRLMEATSIVVLWTGNSVRSDWVIHEATIAAASSKLVQLRMSGVSLPSRFAELQAADVQNWEENTFPRGIRLSLNAIASLQSRPPVLEEYAHIRRLKISGSKVMRFVHDKKHHEGYFPKLDGPLFKDIWEMEQNNQIKLYDELHRGSKFNMDEERYYELIEYLSEDSE